MIKYIILAILLISIPIIGWISCYNQQQSTTKYNKKVINKILEYNKHLNQEYVDLAFAYIDLSGDLAASKKEKETNLKNYKVFTEKQKNEVITNRFGNPTGPIVIELDSSMRDSFNYLLIDYDNLKRITNIQDLMIDTLNVTIINRNEIIKGDSIIIALQDSEILRLQGEERKKVWWRRGTVVGTLVAIIKSAQVVILKK